jgi:hypothetical protein
MAGNGSFAASLDAEAARKQRMTDAGVDAADPAERGARKSGHCEEGTCRYCLRACLLDTTAPEDEQLWRDEWLDADCPDSPDGLHETAQTAGDPQ